MLLSFKLCYDKDKKRRCFMQKISKKCFQFILICMCIFLFLYIVNAISIICYSKIDDKKKADVIIVLGASTYNDKVSPVFQERLNHGIWLYQHGYAQKIILTGGYGKGNQHSDSFVAREYVINKGIRQTDILIEEKSTITQDNLKYAKEIMDNFAYRSAIIVSDPLHMKRAILMAEDYQINAYSSPTPTTRYKSLNSQAEFLKREVLLYIGYQIYRIFY